MPRIHPDGIQAFCSLLDYWIMIRIEVLYDISAVFPYFVDMVFHPNNNM